MDSSNKLPFETNLQRTIIKRMVSNEAFLLKCNLYLKEEYFDNQYLGWLFKTVQDYYKSFQKCPSVETIRNEILKFNVNDRISYDKVFEQVLDSNYTDYDYLNQQLTVFVKRAYLLEQVNRIVNLYNKSSSCESAFQVLKELGQNFMDIDFDKDDIYDFNNLMQDIDIIKNASKFRIPLGIRPIDEALLGGIAKGDLCLILGGTNIGKSVILTNLARNFVEKDKKVLYISLENKPEEDLVRFLSCMTDVPIYRFKECKQLTKDEQIKIITAKQKLQDCLFLYHEFENDLTIDKIISYCTLKSQITPYDALIIDYVQMIKHKSTTMQQHQVQGEVVQSLEKLARRLKVPLISVIQANKSAVVKTKKSKGMSDLMRFTDVGESYAQIKHADIVITVTRSDQDVAKNRMRFLLDKNRGGEVGILTENEVDFNCTKMFTPDLFCRKMQWKDSVKRDDDGNIQDDELEERRAIQDEGQLNSSRDGDVSYVPF